MYINIYWSAGSREAAKRDRQGGARSRALDHQRLLPLPARCHHLLRTQVCWCVLCAHMCVCVCACSHMCVCV